MFKLNFLRMVQMFDGYMILYMFRYCSCGRYICRVTFTPVMP